MNFELILNTLILVCVMIVFPVFVYRFFFFHKSPYFLGLMLSFVHLVVFFFFFIFIHVEKTGYFDFSGYLFSFMIIDFPAIVMYYMSFGVTFIFFKVDREMFVILRSIIAFALFGTMQQYIVGVLFARAMRSQD